MRISDWSSDVCSSDLVDRAVLYRVLYVHQPDDVQRMGQGLGLAADFRDHGRLKRMRRQPAGAVPGMDAGLHDMLHDSGEVDLPAVDEGGEVDCDSVTQIADDETVMIDRDIDSPGQETGKEERGERRG